MKTAARPSVTGVLPLVALFTVSLPAPALFAAERAADGAAGQPWRLATQADWLTLSVQHRARYETIDGQYRSGSDGGDQGLALRTLVAAELARGSWRVGAEMLDARMYFDDAGTTLDTSQVNAAELVQGYVAWQGDTDFGLDLAARSELKLGRQTIDLGSRRLLARSLFRNTINAFNGADWTLTGASGWMVRSLAVLPVVRRPDARDALGGNVAEFDEDDSGSVLWAAALRSMPLAFGSFVEGYVVGLNESDDDAATRNRRLYTPGIQWWRNPARGHLDFELEVMLQLGVVRETASAADRVDLDHFAHFEHAQLGYTIDAVWTPRLLAQFDYASGDGDPADGDSGRFDTLFSARRFEFGPTGLWGAFARANLISAGGRLIVAPRSSLQLTLAQRAFWLAERRDAWVPAAVRDRSGAAGRFIGHQTEWIVTWTAVPGNVVIEGGGVWLTQGEFAQNAPNAAGNGDSTYLYTQIMLTF